MRAAERLDTKLDRSEDEEIVSDNHIGDVEDDEDISWVKGSDGGSGHSRV